MLRYCFAVTAQCVFNLGASLMSMIGKVRVVVWAAITRSQNVRVGPQEETRSSHADSWEGGLADPYLDLCVISARDSFSLDCEAFCNVHVDITG